MSEEREGEQAGAPIEQEEVTENQVLAAVERASENRAPEAGVDGAPVQAHEGAHPVAGQAPVTSAFPPGVQPETGQQLTAEPVMLPAAPQVAPGAPPGAPATPGAPAAPGHPLPHGAPAPLPPVQDGEIRISADHPMAALYMQSPMPPEMRGNRGAGVLIALLATVAFALVYAGIIALWLAPNFPPSTFFDQGLLPWILSWGFGAAVVGFFISLALTVLIVGRAGWWAYVLGGFLVAVVTWVFALAGFGMLGSVPGITATTDLWTLLTSYGLFFPIIAAGLVAREAAVWFGAWIGARGRKMKRLNTVAIAEYEQALAEAQANQP